MKEFIDTIKSAWRLFKEEPISFCIAFLILFIIVWAGYDRVVKKDE